MNIISKITTYLKKRQKLIKNIIMLTLVVVFLSSVASSYYYKNLYNEKADSILSTSIDNKVLKNQNSELAEKIQEQSRKIDELQNEIVALESEIKNKQSTIHELQTRLANEQDYPDDKYVQSTYIWNYLKSLGLSNYVCAGILGNIMTEVGGQTLDISKYSTKHVNGYYGICQWAGPRKTRLLNDFGSSLESQCKFLGVELFEVIPQDNSFYDMQNEKQAALYFAQHYERCHSSSYYMRQLNATKALDYFTNNVE